MSHPRGFTLLELIISLTIMSAVIVGVYATLSLGTDASERGEARSIENQRIRAALSLITRQLKSAYPLLLQAEGDAFVYFFGESDELHFIASSSRPEIGGLEKVSYFIREEDGRRSLWMRVSAPALPADLVEDREGGLRQETEVLPDIDELVWEYFGTQQTEQAWQDHWSGKEVRKLPKAVRLSWRAQVGNPPNEWRIEVPIHVQAPLPGLRTTPQRRRQARG